MPALAPRPCKGTNCSRTEYVSPKGKRDGRCNSCRLALEKARDPQAHAYRKLKSNAKGRNIFFDLTLDEFRAFCYETDILNGRGRSATSWHVDRIIDALGYTAGNLQKLTNTENLAKEMQRRRRVKSVMWVSNYDYFGEERAGGVLRTVDLGTAGDETPEAEDVPF
jgi:hypothetical protein